MDWSFSNNQLSFCLGDFPFSVHGLSGSVEIDGVEHSTSQCIRDVKWDWEVCEDNGVLSIAASLENKGSEPVCIEHWNILCGGQDALQLKIAPEQCLIFRYFPWNMAVKDFTVSEVLYTDSIVLFTDKGSGKTLFISFETLDRMYCEHRVAVDSGRCSGYFAECFTGKYNLKPGMKLNSERISIRYVMNPYAALEGWAERLQKHYRPELPEESEVVFCNGWRDFFTLPDMDPTTEIPASAVMVKKHFAPFCKCTLYDNPHYTMLNGLPGNWLSYEKSLSGEDFGEFFTRLHAEEGWTFKSWFSPFWFFGEAEETLLRNWDNLQKNFSGEPIVEEFRGGWEYARREYGQRVLLKYFLDGTHPATKEYLKEVLLEKRRSGVRSYMLDFLSILPGAVIHDDTLLPVEAARKILKDIREIVGSDTHLQTAVASSPIFIGCVDSARVVRDYGESRPQHPFHNWRNASYCLHDEHFANTHSFLQNAAASYFTNGRIYMNDLNCLTIDEPVPLHMAQINVTMIGLSGDSPVCIADDLTVITPERMRMLKMCFPRTKGIPRPADLFDRTSGEGGCRILVKNIRTHYEEYTLAAVFNTMHGSGIFAEDIQLERLGCNADGKYRVYEFWNREYVGTFRGTFPCSVPPGQCRLYRISESRNHPWILSTNMHVEQGRCEVPELKWDETTLTLSGKACRPVGECGRIEFLLPWNYRVVNHCGVNTMKEVVDMQTVASLQVNFTADEMPFEIHFAKDEADYVTRKDWLPYETAAEWREYVKQHREDYHPSRIIE